jgi:hypothetical protein
MRLDQDHWHRLCSRWQDDDPRRLYETSHLGRGDGGADLKAYVCRDCEISRWTDDDALGPRTLRADERPGRSEDIDTLTVPNLAPEYDDFFGSRRVETFVAISTGLGTKWTLVLGANCEMTPMASGVRQEVTSH